MDKNAVNVSVPLFVIVPVVFVLFALYTLLGWFIVNDDGTRGSSTIGIRGLFETIQSNVVLEEQTQSDVLASYGKPPGATSTLTDDGTEFSVWMYEYKYQLTTFYYRNGAIYGIHYSKVRIGSENRWLKLDRSIYDEYLDLTCKVEAGDSDP